MESFGLGNGRFASLCIAISALLIAESAVAVTPEEICQRIGRKNCLDLDSDGRCTGSDADLPPMPLLTSISPGVMTATYNLGNTVLIGAKLTFEASLLKIISSGDVVICKPPRSSVVRGDRFSHVDISSDGHVTVGPRMNLQSGQGLSISAAQGITIGDALKVRAARVSILSLTSDFGNISIGNKLNAVGISASFSAPNGTVTFGDRPTLGANPEFSTDASLSVDPVFSPGFLHFEAEDVQIDRAKLAGLSVVLQASRSDDPKLTNSRITELEKPEDFQYGGALLYFVGRFDLSGTTIRRQRFFSLPY